MVIADNIGNEAGRATGAWVPGYYPEGQEDSDEPKLEDILDLWRQGRDKYFVQFHANCREEEDFILENREVPAPEGIDPIWPATANGIIDTATDHVDINNIQIDVPSSPRTRARAERLKKFYLGVWLSVKKPVLRTAVRQSFLYGIGFLKTMYNADKWPDAPHLEDFNDDEEKYRKALEEFQEVRNIRWPFEIDVIRPRNMVWDDARTRMKWVIEFYRRPTRHLQRRYPEWVPSDASTRSGIVEWLEYWDDEWCIYIADNQKLESFRHGYGHMPYTPIIPANSYTFDDGPPHERYRGMLRPAHNLLDEEARLTTQINAIIRTTAYRTLDFTGPKRLAEETAERYELFGGKNIIPPGVEVAMSPMPNVPPDLYQQLTVVQTMIEGVTFPNVIRGVRPRGVSAGFAMSVLAGMGRLKFQGVADGVRHAIEEVNSKLAMLVENKARGRVTVYARVQGNTFDQTISPDDIRGMYENSVQIKAEAPEERERESLLAMRLHAAGLITEYEAMRRIGITNPLEEQMLKKAEFIANSPEVIMAQTQAVLQASGLPQQLQEAISPSIGGANIGSQNTGGAQLPQLGQANNQQARVASNPNTEGGAKPSVFPQGTSGIDSLGAILGGATGGAQSVPSGQTIRR